MKRNRERRQRLGGRSAAAAETEKDHRIRQLERTLGQKSLEIEILKNVVGGVSCGAVHSQAREMVSEGYTATLVAATLAISRSSLYYRKKPRGSRADRTYDEPIVMACGEKLAYGYRRLAWWLQRKKGLLVKSEACVAGDERTWVAGALATSSCSLPERMGTCGGQRPQSNLAVGHDQDLGGAGGGLGLPG